MNCYTAQEGFDILHEAQCLQANESGKIMRMALDLKAKVAEIESKLEKSKRPIYVNVSEKTMAGLN